VHLSRVRVRNIRSYAEATLELSPGTTLLVGDVGAGKTSLLYAVEMALFGTAEVEATFLVRHGASEAEVEVVLEEDGHRFEVVRSFRRVRRKGKETFEPGRLAFRKDGATTSYSATELRGQVIELLGFPDNPNPHAHSDLWRWAVYVPQERMRDILSAPPRERLETVRRALGVERYRLAAENAKEVARDLRGTASALRSSAELLRQFSDDYDAATAEIARVEELRAAVEARRAGLEADRTRAQGEVTAAQASLHRVEADRRLRESLSEESSADRKALEVAEREFRGRTREAEELARELPHHERTAAELAHLEREAVTASERVTQVRQQIEARASEAGLLGVARGRVLELERRLVALQRDEARVRGQAEGARDRLLHADGGGSNEPVPPVTETLPEIDERLRAARAEETRAREASALGRASLLELDGLVRDGVCPRCGQAVRAEEFGRHQTEAQEAVRTADEAVRAAQLDRERWEKLRTVREEYEIELARWQEALRRRADLEAALTAAEEGLRGTETALVECRIALEGARGEVERVSPVEVELESARRDLTTAESARESVRARLEAAQRASERAAALRDRIRSLEEERTRRSREADGLRARIAARAERLEELEGRLGREPELRARADEAERRLTDAERAWHVAAQEATRWATQLESLRERRVRAERGRSERARLVESAETTDAKAAWLSGAFHDAVLTMEARVLERAQAEFEHRFQRYFASLVDDPEMLAVTDAAFSPAADIRGVRTPAEALSGGERTSLALAYRLALARVVRSSGHLRLDTLLLDEPTDGFSPEQVQSMGQLLEELDLPQVLLVSHERELEAVAQRVVWAEKEDGVSVLRGPGTGRSVTESTVEGPTPEPSGTLPVSTGRGRRARGSRRGA
jgi:exonuclease SbcC